MGEGQEVKKNMNSIYGMIRAKLCRKEVTMYVEKVGQLLLHHLGAKVTVTKVGGGGLVAAADGTGGGRIRV